VSYNVLPGWRSRGMLRDMLLYRARGAATAGERLARARDLLAHLCHPSRQFIVISMCYD